MYNIVTRLDALIDAKFRAVDIEELDKTKIYFCEFYPKYKTDVQNGFLKYRGEGFNRWQLFTASVRGDALGLKGVGLRSADLIENHKKEILDILVKFHPEWKNENKDIIDEFERLGIDTSKVSDEYKPSS